MSKDNLYDGSLLSYFAVITIADITAVLNLLLVVIGIIIGYYRARINRREWRKGKKD